MARKQRPEDNPVFNRQDYELLRRERRRLADLIGTLDKAEACGIACDTFRGMRQQIDDQLAAIEQHFMTPVPG